MPRMPRSKRRASRSRNQLVTVASPNLAFEAKLAKQSDAFCLSGKYIFTSTTSATPNLAVLSLALTPNNLGSRASAVGASFARFRLKECVKWFAGTTSTAGGVVTLGFVDDFSGESDQPSSVEDCNELRCSSTDFLSTTVPTEFYYKPVDPQKWYYTRTGISGSDERLVYPAALYAASTAASVSYTVQIDYRFVFVGAAP